MSLMPGAAVDTTSTRPPLTRRLEMRARPCSSRYSTRATSGVSARARMPGARSRSAAEGCVAATVEAIEAWLGRSLPEPYRSFLAGTAESFLAGNGHVWLVAFQLFGFAGYLFYSVRFYVDLAPLIAAARAEWRGMIGDNERA